MTGAKRTILRRERRPTVFSDEALRLFREPDRQPKPDDAAVHRLARLLGLVPQYWTVNSPLDKSSAPVHPHGYQAHNRTAVTYDTLRKECLETIRQWPGCETVAGIQLIRDNSSAGFSAKVILYGRADKRTADRAMICVQREKRRHYRLTD